MTTAFIPDRINKYPTVFRGLTVTEVFMSLSVGAVIGALIGLFVFLLIWPKWVLIVTFAVVMAAVTLMVSGSLFARLKRGKPDNWLYRHLGVKLFNLGLNRSSGLVLSNDIWSIRRSPK